jgi:hypothetical protein
MHMRSTWASLIPSLIHLRTPASIGVHHTSLSWQLDLHGQSCTVILNPEKRKVGVTQAMGRAVAVRVASRTNRPKFEQLSRPVGQVVDGFTGAAG